LSFILGPLSRIVFLELSVSALLGAVLFTFVLFLQRAGRIFEIVVKTSAPPAEMARLFALLLPQVLPYAVPIAVLVGVLMALSRMAADGEVTGMRAAGIPGSRLARPVLLFAFFGMCVAAACSTWLTPWSIRESYRVLNRVLATQLTTDVEPRVFEEQFERTVLYVSDIVPGQIPLWRNLFMADLTPPGERKGRSKDLGDAPKIVIAREALAVPDPALGRIRLIMKDGSTHEVAKDPATYYSTGAPTIEQALEAQRRSEVRTAKAYTELDMGPLYREIGKSVEARVEFHQRLALPPACMLLALVGLPLGISTRKGGKSVALVITVALALAYYTSLIGLIGLAKEGRLGVAAAVWLPDAALLIAGIVLFLRLEKASRIDVIGTMRALGETAYMRIRHRMPDAGTTLTIPWLRGFPQVMDKYVLNTFLFYVALFLAGFVITSEVFFFFELLGDTIRHNVAMSRVFTYLFFLTPKLIYDTTPMAVLVAVLVTFGIMAKNNEVTAAKACGTSIHRLALPVLVASLLLSAGLFAFDYYVVPDANRRQDALRAEIKGKPVQTYLNPDRKWIFGRGSRIFYYRFFDPKESVMGEANIYELEPGTFQLSRHIYAERARWEPSLKTWICQNGWARDFGSKPRYLDFHGAATTFSELTDPPDWFMRELIQEKQMNFDRLAQYINELKQSGFNTITLQVQFYKKFAVPLFALIMAMISVPFAFLTGHRGAMAGVGVSFSVAIAYWALSQLFEQVGNVNLLPPALAAWAPDTVFALAGMYLLARMRT
jgi:LPS export ABC transporter permease LptG/LPS export ABC transporter permease LptF